MKLISVRGSEQEDDEFMFELTFQHHEPYLGERDRSEHEEETDDEEQVEEDEVVVELTSFQRHEPYLGERDRSEHEEQVEDGDANGLTDEEEED